jgi:hypothetical protein
VGWGGRGVPLIGFSIQLAGEYGVARTGEASSGTKRENAATRTYTTMEHECAAANTRALQEHTRAQVDRTTITLARSAIPQRCPLRLL